MVRICILEGGFKDLHVSMNVNKTQMIMSSVAFYFDKIYIQCPLTHINTQTDRHTHTHTHTSAEWKPGCEFSYLLCAHILTSY